MAHPAYPHPDPDPDSDAGPGGREALPRGRSGPTPRWLTVAGIVLAVALVVVFVVLHVTGVVGPGAN